ncbi:MAG: DUF2157 domain-containing protein [Chitinophagaceae bacterium]
MKTFNRDDLHTFVKHSNINEQAVKTALEQHIYPQKKDWQKFLQIFFITLGIGFTVAGIIFFFAYNWNHLHKFVKIGLILGLVIVTTLFSIYGTKKTVLQQLLMVGAFFLVGVLFAVFGQIYQTGANAYDFFLAWTVFTTLWVFNSNFSPLWLCYFSVMHTTVFLYAQQVATNWPNEFVYLILFVLSVITFVLMYVYASKNTNNSIHNWLLQTIALAATVYATFGMVIAIFQKYEFLFFIFLFLVAMVYYLGFWLSNKLKNIYYQAIIFFSLIVIITAFLLEISDGEGMFLFIFLFIIFSITMVIRRLVELQKQWSHES